MDIVQRGGLPGVGSDPVQFVFYLGNLLWAYLSYRVYVRVAHGRVGPGSPPA